MGNTLLDLYEDLGQAAGQRKFVPQNEEAFQQILMPIFRDIAAKTYGVLPQLTAGLKNLEWFTSTNPIVESGDACLLVKVNTVQVAKQDNRNVAISEQWYRKADNMNRAALMLHEMLMHAHGINADCSTNVRDAVRFLLSSREKTGDEIIQKLTELGIIYKGDYLTTDKSEEYFQKIRTQLVEPMCGPEAPENDKAWLAQNSYLGPIGILPLYQLHTLAESYYRSEIDRKGLSYRHHLFDETKEAFRYYNLKEGQWDQLLEKMNEDRIRLCAQMPAILESRSGGLPEVLRTAEAPTKPSVSTAKGKNVRDGSSSAEGQPPRSSAGRAQ